MMSLYWKSGSPLEAPRLVAVVAGEAPRLGVTVATKRAVVASVAPAVAACKAAPQTHKVYLRSAALRFDSKFHNEEGPGRDMCG